MKKNLLVLKYFEKKENYSKIRSFCLQQFSNNKELAEDALHAIIVKLINSADKIKFPEDESEAQYFISRTIKNLVIDEARKKKIRNVVAIIEADIEQENLNAVHLNKLENLKDAMTELKPTFTAQQWQLWQYLYEGKTTEEMMSLMNKKYMAIAKAKSKLFDKINKLINENDLY